VLAALKPEAAAADALLAAAPVEDVAQKLFPQWRFAHLATFRSVALVPSLAMAPFLSFRLTAGEHALIIFPVGQRPSEDLVSALKALAHPQRLEILRIAGKAPVTGHALAQTLGLTEATVHHHTSLLRAAGLLASNRDANQVHLAAVPGALPDLFTRILGLTGERGLR
jgi:DNA-binding transcriptional ArsR family regulator